MVFSDRTDTAIRLSADITVVTGSRRDRVMHTTAGRNRLGALAIALAVMSIVSYGGGVVLSRYPGALPGKLGILAFLVPPLAAP